jgi:amino acid permease
LSLILGGASDMIPEGIIEEDPASLHPVPPPSATSNASGSASASASGLLMMTEGSFLIPPQSHRAAAAGGLGGTSSSSCSPGSPAASSVGVDGPAAILDLETDKSKAFDVVTYSAVAVCAVLYSSISLLALLEFDAMTPNLLAKYPVHAKVMQVAAAAVGLAVVLAFPLNVVPARTSLARSLIRPEIVAVTRAARQQQQSPQAPRGHRHPRDNDDDDDDRTLLRSNPAAAAAVAVGAAAAAGASSSLRSHVQTPLLQENRVRVRSRHRPLGTVAHMALTLVVAGGALLVAIVVPDISVVFGLLGGTTTSWLGFCLPGWLGIRLLSKRWRVVSYLLLVGGVVIGVVTTAVTVATMF